MEIKLSLMKSKKKNILFCIFFILLNINLSGQEDNDEIKFSEINVEGFKYNSSINDLRKIFGPPESKKVIDQTEDGPEGRDYLIIYLYDSLEVMFVKNSNNRYLSQILINGGEYKVNIEKKSLSVGDKIEKLKNYFPGSYKSFLKEKEKSSEKEKYNLFVNLIIHHAGNKYKPGTLKITLRKGIIESIAIDFDAS